MAIQSSNETRVAILARNGDYCAHLAALITGSVGCNCVGIYHSTARTLKGVTEVAPDVLIFDLEAVIPLEHIAFEVDGPAFVNKLRDQSPSTKVIVLTPAVHKQNVLRLFEAGAVGCLNKPIEPTRLLSAISEVHSGGAPMCPQTARAVVEYLHNRGFRRASFTHLTAQEQRVLEYMSEGKNRQEIAKALSISALTVTTHFRHIYEKLGVHSQAQVVAQFLGQEVAK